MASNLLAIYAKGYGEFLFVKTMETCTKCETFEILQKSRLQIGIVQVCNIRTSGGLILYDVK